MLRSSEGLHAVVACTQVMARVDHILGLNEVKTNGFVLSVYGMTDYGSGP